MIYATMCIGEHWCKKYSTLINDFSKKNKIHILTDTPSYFKDGCIIYHYTRDVFSYYEKINHILSLLQKYKTRVLYIDADWVSQLDTSLLYDSTSIYCYNKFELSSSVINRYFSKDDIKKVNDILSIIKLNKNLEWYIPEALLCFPYLDAISNISLDFNKLQKPLEELYNKTPQRKELARYTESGIGYGEGWAITAIAYKYNINVNTFDGFPNKSWRKISTI